MNYNLHDALRSLAHTAGETSSDPTALALADRSVAAVERRHRRRPMMAAGLTGLGVLTAGAAAALGYSYLQDDDAAPFPDRLTPETTKPSSAPVSITCGAGVGDLVATVGPLELGSEAVDAANGSPVALGAEPASGLSMYLRNASTAPVTITTTRGLMAFLVQDGHVVALPAPPTERAAVPAASTLAPADTRTLIDDGLVPCPDASGATPTSIPAGDYDAYGVVAVGLDGTAEPLELVGGPWPVSVDARALAPVATLPAADPVAVVPQCGAVIDPPAGLSDIVISAGVDPYEPLDTSISTDLYTSAAGARGEVSTDVTVVAVKDGVVVGSAGGTRSEATTPFTFDTKPPTFRNNPATLALTLCTDGATPLPAGRYSVWALQEYTLTELTPYDETSYPGTPVPMNEDGTTFTLVGSLWMGPDGTVVANPGVAAGWPQSLDEVTAFAGRQQPEPESVVWIEVSTSQDYGSLDPALISAQDHLADLGYVGGEIPFQCQGGSPSQLGLTAELTASQPFGIGVIFATRAEAEAFVSLWEPLNGPVVGVVTEGVYCHWS